MDSIRRYLKDIRDLPLLKADDEREIARRVKRGDKKARQQMIKSNLRLVINIAKKYSYLGVPILDLIEEGNLGLMKAVSKFDPDKGYRFSTYAAWWIKQYITRAVANQGKTVRIPVYVMEMLMRFQKVKRSLKQSKSKNPEIVDVAKKMRIPLARAKQLNRMESSITSLNAPIGDSGDTEFMDLIEDESIVSAVDELSKFLLQERIGGLLNKMTDREKKILTLRFGLKDGASRTLRETARHFGITRERVRQIEASCMFKLRKMMQEQEEEAETAFTQNSSVKGHAEKQQAAETTRIIRRSTRRKEAAKGPRKKRPSKKRKPSAKKVSAKRKKRKR